MAAKKKVKASYPDESPVLRDRVVEHARRQGKDIQVENVPKNQRGFFGYKNTVIGTTTAPSQNELAIRAALAAPGAYAGAATANKKLSEDKYDKDTRDAMAALGSAAGATVGNFAGQAAYKKYGSPQSVDYGQAKRAYLKHAAEQHKKEVARVNKSGYLPKTAGKGALVGALGAGAAGAFVGAAGASLGESVAGDIMRVGAAGAAGGAAGGALAGTGLGYYYRHRLNKIEKVKKTRRV